MNWVRDEGLAAAEQIARVAQGKATADVAARDYLEHMQTRGGDPTSATAEMMRHAVTLLQLLAQERGQPVDVVARKYAEAARLSRLDTDLESPDADD